MKTKSLMFTLMYLAKELGNPMREPDYCKKAFKNCESLDARPETGNLPKDVADYKKQCQG